jgi:hypothetical protein
MGLVIPFPYGLVIHPVRHVGAAKDWTITYGITVTPGSAEDIALALDTAFRTAWRPTADSGTSFKPCTIYAPTASNVMQVFTSTATTVAGTGAARSSPSPQVSVVLRKRTDFVGRRYRGRMFLPSCFLNETAIEEDGTVAAATLSSFQSIANTWLDNIAAVSGVVNMYLLHSDEEGQLTDTPAPTQVTSLLAQTVVRTQRRRLPRG